MASTASLTTPSVGSLPGEAMSDSGSTKATPLQRGQMRRRLRHQQRIREALLLDLGALVFELHRQGRREPELLQAKAAEVSAVDNEVRALAEALDADGAVEMLAPGVEGICGNCGTLLSTEDRFCPHCGTPKEAALTGDEPPTADAMGASENGTGEHDLEQDEHGALGAAPPPEPAPEAAGAAQEDREDLGKRVRRGVDRLFSRRPQS
jgi:hypothetical protein